MAVVAAFAIVTFAHPSAAYDRFFEDFTGPELDTSRWDTGQLVSGMRWCSSTVWSHHTNPGEWVDVSAGTCHGRSQAAPYGTVTFVSSDGGTTGARFSYIYPELTFPYLFAGPGHPESPFPPTGDFVLEIRMRYDGLSGHGDGVYVTGWQDPTPVGDTPPVPAGQSVWGIWGDSSIYRSVGRWCTYRLEYRDGVYTSFIDGAQQGSSWASALRPATIWIGNPVFTFWGASAWSPFTIDYIRVSVPQLEVPIDVKPGGCPNPFNVNSAGVLPVAIPGTETLDVASIDPTSVRIEGVAPLRAAIEDVATPFTPFVGKSEALDCTSARSDGVPDLALKFDAAAVAGALGPVEDGEVRTLRVTGALKPEFGATAIGGEDVVVLIVKK